MTRTIGIVDTTTRDGNQSLWSATGLRTADILQIAPTLDRIGFHAADFTSSTHMGVAVRFHQEDPWERTRLVSAAMPNTPLSFITTGMRFITWTPADEEVMRLAFRCVARNGIRRFQIADPTNEPDAAAPDGRGREAGGRRGGRDRPDVLDLGRPHARVLRRAGGGARRLPRHGPALSQGSRRPADAGGRARARAALRRGGRRAPDRAAQPHDDRARAVRLRRRAPCRLRRPAHGDRAARPRHVEPGRRDDDPRPAGRGLRPRARSRRDRRGRGALPRDRRGATICRSASRRSSTRPTTTTSSRAGWCRRRSGCSRSCGGPSCSTPCSRRSGASARRWATRSSSRPSRSSSPRRRCGT